MERYSTHEGHDMPDVRLYRGRIFRILGAIALLLGLLGAGLLYRPGGGSGDLVGDSEVSDPLAPEDYKAYSRDMEFFGGKIWIVVEKGRRWLVGLARGNGPALLLALGGLAVGGLLWQAGRQPLGKASAKAADKASRNGPGHG